MSIDVDVRNMNRAELSEEALVRVAESDRIVWDLRAQGELDEHAFAAHLRQTAAVLAIFSVPEPPEPELPPEAQPPSRGRAW